MDEVDAPVPRERSGSESSANVNIFAGWLSKMNLTNEEFLRAAPASEVVGCCGRVLRGSAPTTYSQSHAVKTINRFISHSWQASAWSKTLTLLVFYNATAAAIFATLLAVVMMILSALHLLPGIIKDAGPLSDSIVVAPWCLTVGFVSFWAVLIFRPPRDLVFLDLLCIDQEDPKRKTAGILNLGACLKNSQQLLVIWDENFCERLWCMFELAAYLRSHETTHFLVQPIALGKFVAVRISLHILQHSLVLLLPEDAVLAPYFSIPAFAVYSWIICTIVFQYVQSVEAIERHLLHFRVEDAKCHCCSVGHQTQDGERIFCDREVILKCIQNWFGSVKEFEKCVQTTVKDALTHRLGRNFCPYTLLAVATIPSMWVQMDFAAARLRKQDTDVAVCRLLIGIASWLVLSPLIFSLTLLSLRCTRSCRRGLRKLIASVVPLTINLAAYRSAYLLVDRFGMVTGTAIWTATPVLPSILFWWGASRAIWFIWIVSHLHKVHLKFSRRSRQHWEKIYLKKHVTVSDLEWIPELVKLISFKLWS